jgi:hypothetical protein
MEPNTRGRDVALEASLDAYRGLPDVLLTALVRPVHVTKDLADGLVVILSPQECGLFYLWPEKGARKGKSVMLKVQP